MASALCDLQIDKGAKLEEVVSQWLALADDENEFCEIQNAIEE